MMNRREFCRVLAAAAAAGFPSYPANSGQVKSLYDLPTFGNNVTLLHITDTHAQLLPLYYREPNVHIGVGEGEGRPPHLVGRALLELYGMSVSSKQAYAYSHLDFEKAARTYGKVGGFAHLATLVKKIREQRPGALLLDGGDTLQGSATSLYTQGADMVDAMKLLGVNVMTGHWEFTLGEQRLREIVEQDLKGKIDFVAHNVTEGDSPVFKPYVMKEMNGIPIAIIGQAYPHTHLAHPRHFTKNFSFGIEEEALQKRVTEVKKQGAQVVVLLSHNGMGIDLKLASRVHGINVILGGHTHDAAPHPMLVKNPYGYTLVANGGSHGKFLGVLDLNVKSGKVAGYQYKLLPVFSNLLDADKPMATQIAKARAPYEAKLDDKLAVTHSTLYRRGNFMGSFDQVILDALMHVKDAEIAFSPGFRFGPTLLPGQAVTMEHVMDMTAITYPETEVKDMTGSEIKQVLEQTCDHLFNPDPYQQHGSDMLRVGGMHYTCDPNKSFGNRVTYLTLSGKAMDASKKYKVASWGGTSVAKGQPVWEVVADYLKHKKEISAIKPSMPKLVGVDGDPGVA
jgi:sulfur-oxidizing protein SoxB